MKKLLIAAAASMMLSAAFAAPTYTYSVAPSGPYADTGGTELTDTVIGSAGWGVNSGRWVGWDNKPSINIDFDFGGQYNFSAVSVGSTQDSTYGLLRLPDVVVSSWNGSSWVQQGELDITFSTTDDKNWLDASPHTWLTVSGLSFNSDKVRVTLNSNGQKWVFADEVQFTATPVPEPETYAMMLAGLGALGFMARRRQGK